MSFNGRCGFGTRLVFQTRANILKYDKIITIEPGKRSGQPCIRGTRMTVKDVLEYLASEMTVDEVLSDFPDLTIEDIKACLAFAADRLALPTSTRL